MREGTPLWRIEALLDAVHLHEVVLDEQQVLERLVRGIQPQWVFHLAAHGSYPTQTSLHQMLQTNISGTVNLVQACLETGFEAFINTGSSSEYGHKDYAPSEQEWLDPNSHYAITKAFAHTFAASRLSGIRFRS